MNENYENNFVETVAEENYDVIESNETYVESSESNGIADALIKVGIFAAGAAAAVVVTKVADPVKEKAGELIANAREKREESKAKKAEKKANKKAKKAAKKKGHIEGTAEEVTEK